MAGIVEGLADAGDAAVHHVGRADDVAAGLGLHDGLAAQCLDGLVVEDPIALHDAVVAVRGIGIERDVAEDADLRHGGLDRAACPADEIALVEGLAA